jgi:hypothetical protein
MNYEINPCKACVDKFKSGKCNINNINQCCYDTLAAFSGSASVNSVRNTEGAKNCVQCVHNAMKAIGRTPCDLQLAPPPVWNQVPHYLPKNLSQGMNLNEAKNMCLVQCEDGVNMNACKENCLTDVSAVVETYENNGQTYNNYVKDDPIVFYVTFGIFAFFFSVILTCFLRSLMETNHLEF